jgi:hypothetical protein
VRILGSSPVSFLFFKGIKKGFFRMTLKPIFRQGLVRKFLWQGNLDWDFEEAIDYIEEMFPTMAVFGNDDGVVIVQPIKKKAPIPVNLHFNYI